MSSAANRCLYVLLLLLACGCGTSVSYVPTNTVATQSSRLSPQQVEVYTTAPPQRPYTEVGYFEAEEGTFGTMEDTMNDLRREAARRGCHGLVVVNSGTATDYDPWVGMRTERRIQAACIVYPEYLEAQPPPQPAETEQSPNTTDNYEYKVW